MTYQIKCICGSEFYISIVDESYAITQWVKGEAQIFHETHKNCCKAKIIEDLPEDWKV